MEGGAGPRGRRHDRGTQVRAGGAWAPVLSRFGASVHGECAQDPKGQMFAAAWQGDPGEGRVLE